MKSFVLNFKGYWREQNKDHIPSLCGVYLVYRCVPDLAKKTVSLRELIYIGKSSDIKRSIGESVEIDLFRRELRMGEELCYSVAAVNRLDLALVQSALVFAQQPRLNNSGKDSFDYPDASFNIGGRCALLRHTSFSISNS